MGGKVNFVYDNGDVLKDRVTGLEGVVMVRAEYSTGCHHYGLLPQEINDSKEPDWTWFDQSRLDLVKSKGVVFKTQDTPPSGSFPAGPK